MERVPVRRKKRRWTLLLLLLAAATALAVTLQLLQKQLYPMRYAQAVEESAREFGLDPLLVYSFIRTESGFDPMAESTAGARGLMQITQETYGWLHGKLAPDLPQDFDTMYDPATNIRYGCCLIAASLARYGQDVSTAAAAYHSGWGTVDALLLQDGYSDDGATLSGSPYVNMNWYMEKIRRSYAWYRALYA